MNDTTFQGNGSVKYVPVVVDAKPKPITNAMKIRSMSDEELAMFIHDQIIDRNIGIPSETWLDWLRQEVDNAKDQPAT